MQALPSSLKSENPNSQYTGYRLFGFHPLSGGLLPRYRVCQLKNPQKTCPTSVPKNRVFPPFAGGKTDKAVQDMKILEISPIPTPDSPWKTPKTLKNLLDTLRFWRVLLGTVFRFTY
jgi:hypothetical protein